jgi:hypothetical protein
MNHAWGDGPALSDEKGHEQGGRRKIVTAGRSESIRVMAG